MTIRHVSPSTQTAMQSGDLIDATRPRSEGILTQDQIAFCRKNGVPLAFDPIQIGWVLAGVTDDIGTEAAHPRAGWSWKGFASRKPSSRRQMGARAPDYRLRPWHQNDVPQYLALLDDPEVWRWLPEDYPDPLTPEVAKALIELSNGSNHHQVHAVLRDDTVVGQVRLQFNVDPSDHTVAEISYWLGKAYWGAGIATAVVDQFTQRAFDAHTGIARLIARVHRQNAASRRVLEKAGYRRDRAAQAPDDWIMLCHHRP